jgi:hypothetical protein
MYLAIHEAVCMSRWSRNALEDLYIPKVCHQIGEVATSERPGQLRFRPELLTGGTLVMGAAW